MAGRVLVVGGGVAGFGVARALSSRGVPCTLVERLEPVPASVLGLNLPGNAVRALGALGVGDEAVRSGWPILRREYRTSADRVLFEIDEAEFWSGVAPSVCLRRTALLDLLRAGVDPATVRWGCPFVHAEPAGEAVRVQLGTGPTEEFGFVVGADGVHSATRQAVVGEESLRSSRMSVASWRFQAPNPGIGCWTAWSGRAGTFMVSVVCACRGVSRAVPVFAPFTASLLPPFAMRFDLLATTVAEVGSPPKIRPSSLSACLRPPPHVRRPPFPRIGPEQLFLRVLVGKGPKPQFRAFHDHRVDRLLDRLLNGKLVGLVLGDARFGLQKLVECDEFERIAVNAEGCDGLVRGDVDQHFAGLRADGAQIDRHRVLPVFDVAADPR